jgi:hypothetical protein
MDAADIPELDPHGRPERRLVSVLMSRSVMPVFSRAVRLADRQPGERDAGRPLFIGQLRRRRGR